MSLRSSTNWDLAEPQAPHLSDTNSNRILLGFLFAVYLVAVGYMIVLPEPVLLVTAAGALSLLFAPVCYVLICCATRLVDDVEYRPARFARVVAIAGIVFVTLGAGLFLYIEVYLKLIVR